MPLQFSSFREIVFFTNNPIIRLVFQKPFYCNHNQLFKRCIEMVKVGEYELREDLYYWGGGEKGKGQTWAKLESDGRVRVGMTDLGVKIAGKIRFIRIKPPGRSIEQGKGVATIETGKWVGPVEAPITGTIAEINRTLRRKPQTFSSDPYGDGWVAVLQPSNPEELENLIHGDATVEWYTQEIEKKLKEIKTD
jgi:glycine cleavage system H protein